MKNIYVLLSLFIIPIFNSIAQLNNIQVTQNNTSVLITYDLIYENKNDKFDVNLYISKDGGISFSPITNERVKYGYYEKNIIEGNGYGSQISVGNKKIEWYPLLKENLIYGSNFVFRIEALLSRTTLNDLENGKNYPIIKIDNNYWMAEDLIYDGSNKVSAKIAKSVCPTGWKLPTLDDVNSIVDYQNKYQIFPNGYLTNSTQSIPYANTFTPAKIPYEYWLDNNGENPKFCFGFPNDEIYTKSKKVASFVRCIKESKDAVLLTGNSQIINLSLIDKEIPIYEIPVDYYVQRYVLEKIKFWQQKGEFEKFVDYQKRVTEETRNQQVQILTDEAIESLKKEIWNKSQYNDAKQLGEYDSENETYLIKSKYFGTFALKVPINEAENFKKEFNNFKISYVDFYVNENKMILAKLTFSYYYSKKTYNYDSKKPTKYVSNSITYNFEPINVTVKQDNTETKTNIDETKTVSVGLADIDINIPINSQTNDKTFAVIIANENYSKEVKVEYAANDGTVFKEYCEKTLGIPSKNIHLVQDATFGAMKSEIKWINDVAQAYNGQAKLIFYYAGHGMPNEADKSAYLLPVDGISTDYETAIKLDELYSKLGQNSTQGVTVFLDACFSGSVRDNGMLANARGVKIKPKADLLKGKMIVLTAATGDETAYPYREKQHGLFTYFLLKKIQETKGNVDYQTLSNYITEQVKQQSIVVNQKSQTPQVIASPELLGSWQMMKVK